MTATSTAPVRRGTTNGNDRGNSNDRRRRREWLVDTFRANQDVVHIWGDNADLQGPPTWISETFSGPGLVQLQQSWGRVALWLPACRCYRCGRLLTVQTVTVDRIIPGCEGGTYRRNNIRPACGTCNSETGGALAGRRKEASRG